MKTALKNKDIGLAMWKAKRLDPMEFFGGHAVKDLSGFQKVIKKAEELEAARIAKHGG
jgi:quinone-modifying oxidoreductase subunit QmoC